MGVPYRVKRAKCAQCGQWIEEREEFIPFTNQAIHLECARGAYGGIFKSLQSAMMGDFQINLDHWQ